MITGYSNIISVTTNLLLDLYGGAAAAYSLRRLSNSYAGPLIEVRNDSGVHLDIGFDSNGELDTATLLTHCGSGNGTVSKWYDQSGNSNDATQSTAASQPQIVSSGSVIVNLNNLPTLEFDGIDDHLRYATLTLNQPLTLFLINKYINTSGFKYMVDLGGDRVLGFPNAASTNGMYFGAGLNSTVSPNINNPQLWYALANGLNSELSINNETLITGNAGTRGTTNITIGCYGPSNAFFVNSFISEFIFYASNQSSNRTGIETNINANYNIYWDGSQTSLLDTYSGSAAAYSLRALSSSYTGPLVEVRNDAGVHMDIYAKYDGTLNTDALLSHCGAGNGTVSKWYDQSGNGYDATQSTAANQPQIVISGVYSGYILQNNKVLSTSLPYTNAQNYTNFTVIKQTGGAVIGSTANTGSVFYAVSDTSGASSFQNFSNVSYYKNGSLISGTLRNSIYNAILNQKVVLTSFATNNNTQNMTIGYPGYAAYQINEIIIYASNQSSNQNGIETNINANYNMYWDGSQTSLLDTYGGSAAAYSLRALNSAYTGALIEVRRASDNATQDIYAKYDGSLNVDALESFCSGTDGFVTTWYDQSGNGNDATQSTVANQPQIVSSGSVILENGKPTIYNTVTTGFNLTSNITIDSFTILWVAKKATIASNGSIILYISAATFIGDDVNGRGNPTFWGMIETQYSNTSAPDLETNQHLSYLNRRNSTEAVGQFNDSNNSYNNSITSAQYQISKIALYGTGYNYAGNIQELIIYSSDESSNRTGISTNINDFYSIY